MAQRLERRGWTQVSSSPLAARSTPHCSFTFARPLLSLQSRSPLFLAFAMPPRNADAKAAAKAATKAAAAAFASVFFGQTFCISGKFSRSQAEMEELVTSNGGNVAATPSRKCTYLVANALGSAKTTKAQKDGLDIVTEAWLDQSIKDGKMSTDAKLFLSGPNSGAAGAEGEMEDENEEEEKPAASGAAKKAAPKKAATKAGSKRKAAAAEDDAEEEEEEADAAPAAGAKKAKTKAAPAAAAAAAEAASTPAVPSFTGKKFLLMGGFTAGKYKLESLINSLGGEITTSVLKSLNYCICGTPVSTDYGGVSGPGSKKHKECKKIKSCTMLNEEEFFKLAEQIKAAAPSAGAGAATAGGAAESDDAGSYASLVDDFRAILKLLKVDESKLKPATDAEIAACESEMQMALPGPLRALLRIVNGSSGIPSSAGSPDVPHLFPSTDEIRELFGYNLSVEHAATQRGGGGVCWDARCVVVSDLRLPSASVVVVCVFSAHAGVFRTLRWLPFYMLDYDFAWQGMDRSSGAIFMCDLECNEFKQTGYTMTGQIAQFRNWLETRGNKKDKSADNSAATKAASSTADDDGEDASDSDHFRPTGRSTSIPQAIMTKFHRIYRSCE